MTVSDKFVDFRAKDTVNHPFSVVRFYHATLIGIVNMAETFAVVFVRPLPLKVTFRRYYSFKMSQMVNIKKCGMKSVEGKTLTITQNKNRLS